MSGHSRKQEGQEEIWRSEEGRRRGSVKERCPGDSRLTQNMWGEERVARGADLCHTRHGGRGKKSVIRFEKFLKTFHLNIKCVL